ncbi:uncharacterized protein LOC110727272 [Chenopodium quinoa]|uniref:uncharacterized protein LOC110727272 n=1 Tax=Chenopodium quinoa TaxID=63459 RepID=UPI000B78F8AC|nr:uncharacterized protein LOC110727272 [Chenopodium quinoa]
MVDSVDTIRDHVVCHGFRPQYHVWVWHSEKGSYRENVVGNDKHDKSAEIRAEDEYGSDDGGDGDEEGDEIEDGGGDHLDEMMHNVEGEFGDRCDSDTGFTSLLTLLCDMLPDGNELPKSFYYAKKLMCPFGLEYKKIHACSNDCVLYRNKYEELEDCPRCGMSRYKRKSCNAGMKGSPAKVLWYLPIIPRFKRLFSIPKDAKNLRWHAEGRKKNGLLKHPADSPDWKNIDMKFRAFGDENKGHKACPICIDDTPNVYLEHYGKDVYVRIRRLLRRDHPYRRQKKAFNGKVEEGAAPRPLSGQEVYGQVKGIPTVFEKNVCDAVVGTIMGIHGKTEDGKSAQLDLEAWGVHPEL